MPRPRTEPAKPITLILPSPVPSSSSKPPSSGESSKMAAPSLELLLYTQRLAQDRGQIFDLEAFLTPTQRAQYYATVLRRSPPRSKLDLPQTPGSTGTKRPLEDDTASPGGTPGPDELAEKKRPRIPGLAALHWKQRQKKLAEIAKLEADGEKVDYESFLAATPGASAPSPVVVDGADRPKSSIADSASYWNHLLVQARKERGPQWDFHSQSYHFDHGSKDYYTHGKPPPERRPTPPPQAKTETNSLGMATNGTPRSNGDPLPPPSAPASTSRRRSESRSSAQPSQPSSTPNQPPQRLPPSASSSTYSHSQPGQQFRPPQPPMPQPGNPSPSPSSNGFNPQQLAAFASSNGGFNPAMLQMARAAAANQGNTGANGLTPAQLAQYAGMASMQSAQQMQGYQQARPGGMPPGMQVSQMGQMGQMGQQGLMGMGGGAVRPGGINPAMFQQMNGGQGMGGPQGMAGMGRPPMGMMPQQGQPQPGVAGGNGAWGQGGR